MPDLSLIEKDIQAIIKAGGSDKDVEGYLKGNNVVYNKAESSSPVSKAINPIENYFKSSVQNILEDLMGVKTEGQQAFTSLSQGQLKPAVEAGMRAYSKGVYPGNRGMQKFVQGGAKGVSLGYLDPTQGRRDWEANLGEFAGGFLPYLAAAPLGAPLAGVKGVSLGARLARIGGAAIPMAVVGTLRPAKNIQDRIKQGIFEGTIGAGFQAIPEVAGAIAEPFRRSAAKALSVSSGVPEEDIIKTMQKPSRYAKKPMSTNEEVKIMGEIKDRVIKNIDDLTDFKVKTIEDVVANSPEIKDRAIDVQKVVGAIDDYVNKMNSREITALSGSEMKQIQALKNDLLVSHQAGFSTERAADFSMRADMAHELKKDIYRELKNAYQRPDWTDKVGNAYKIGAHELNAQLRDVLPAEYGLANDKLHAVYQLAEDMGTKGFAKLEGVGGAKKFRNLFNDPEGRQLLKKVEETLEQKDRFIHILEALEDVQRIRKGLQSSVGPMSSTIVPALTGAGGGVGYLTGGPVGATAGAGVGFGVGRAVATPRGLGSLLGTLGNISRAKPKIRPELIPIMLNLLNDKTPTK